MSDLIANLRALARHKHDDLTVADEAADEIERLRAALSGLPRAIGHMREGSLEITPGADPRSWGDGYTTAQQMALNIVNAIVEQRTPEQDAALQELVDQAQELDMGYGQSGAKPTAETGDNR